MDSNSPTQHLSSLLDMVTTPVLAVLVSFFSNAEVWLRLSTLAVGLGVGIVGFLNQCYIWGTSPVLVGDRLF